MTATPWIPLATKRQSRRSAPVPASAAHWRPTPAARRLALAVWIERAITDGRLRNYAHAARVLGVSRARVAQLRWLPCAPVEQIQADLSPEFEK